MRHPAFQCLGSTLVAWFLLLQPTNLVAQESATTGGSADSAAETISPLDAEGRLVKFDRDIVPILKEHCLECHGPEDAKNDFRVDDRDVMLDYIEPEDAESSTVYVDYLTIDDEDMLMPPKSHGGPLSSADLALIRVWIAEGAHWPEDYVFSDSAGTAEAPSPAPPAPQALSERVWVAQGFLHPATVHFPIALFLLGAAFVVLGWKWPSVGMQIPLACLLLGSLSAIASSAMGWAFAPERGYGSGYSIFEWGREVDAHRWSAIIVTVISTVLALIALVALWRGSESLTRVWKVGLLACAAMIGAVGHQGGEMSYGHDFYPKAWRILTGTTEQPEEQAAEVAAPVSTDAVANSHAN